MKKAWAVVGAAMGDEGKGHFTDYLTSKLDNPLVVRHNSGSQAGHTVVTPEGDRHVFSHFGSGTFLGAPTYLGEKFIVNPIQFRIEWEKINKTYGIEPKVYISPACRVTTPYDMLINQIIEESRGNKKHGSCGLGINETITRSQIKPLIYNHIVYEEFTLPEIEYIKKWYVPKRLFDLDIKKSDIRKEYLDLFDNENLLKRYIEDCEFLVNTTIPNGIGILRGTYTPIFEGAQGLLLDEDHRFFPHVTRSKTGLKDIVSICKSVGIEEINVVYMTRPYLTRHGAGPLPYECTVNELTYKFEDQTNVPNEWQGYLRFAPLNLDLMKEAINTDLKEANGLKVNPCICISCMNQMGSRIKYVYNYEIKTVYKEWLHKIISDNVGIEVKYLSNNITREGVKEI